MPLSIADVVGRFDIDVCRVGMTINPTSGERTFHYGNDAEGRCITAGIAARRAHVIFDDNVRIGARVDKYESRGFAFERNSFRNWI